MSETNNNKVICPRCGREVDATEIVRHRAERKDRTYPKLRSCREGKPNTSR